MTHERAVLAQDASDVLEVQADLVVHPLGVAGRVTGTRHEEPEAEQDAEVFLHGRLGLAHVALGDLHVKAAALQQAGLRGGHVRGRLRVAFRVQRDSCGRDEGHLLLGGELACLTFGLRATGARAAAPASGWLDEFDAFNSFCSSEDRLRTRREGAALAVWTDGANQVVKEVHVIHGVGQGDAVLISDDVPDLGGLVLGLAWLRVGVVLVQAAVHRTVLRGDVTQVHLARSDGRARGFLVVRVSSAGGAVAFWDVAHWRCWRGCGQAAVHALQFTTVFMEAHWSSTILTLVAVRSCVVARFCRHSCHRLVCCTGSMSPPLRT